MKTFTIKEIAESLKKIKDAHDPLFKEVAIDDRKGVQRLIQQWYKEQEQKKADLDLFAQMMKHEKEVKKQGFQYITGIDEVGRGPLAGPVVAAAVILPDGFYLAGINDSKKLTDKKRAEYYEYIVKHAISVGIGIISSEEIDRVNIYEATKKAMLSAINELHPTPDYCLIDAMKLTIPIPQTSIIKGDASSVSIAAASIVAKVTRDRMMKDYGNHYPHYKFEQNMGYGTNEHMQALNTYGPCPIHRKTFAPVRNHL